MNVRKFIAATARDALRKVKETLGPDAIILSNRGIPGGVEIMAVAAGDMERMVAPPERPAASPPRRAEPPPRTSEASSPVLPATSQAPVSPPPSAASSPPPRAPSSLHALCRKGTLRGHRRRSLRSLRRRWFRLPLSRRFERCARSSSNISPALLTANQRAPSP